MFKLTASLLVAVLLACGAVWTWATVSLQRRVKADEEFNRLHVQPLLDPAQRKAARQIPPPGSSRTNEVNPWVHSAQESAQESAAHLNEAITRMRRRHHLQDIQGGAIIAGVGAMLLWVLGLQIYRMIETRRWVSLDRPPMVGTGRVVREILGDGQRFEAREPKGRRIEIDPGARRIRFYRFAFITSFWRNPVQELVEFEFAELLVVTWHAHRGRQSLRLRTARGVVWVQESLEPFEPLARLLFDLAELNRTEPDQFRAMCEREPKVKVPWSGWVIFAAALAAVAGFGWWLWTLELR